MMRTGLKVTLEGTRSAYRMGGDEFCVLSARSSDAEDAIALAVDALTEQGEGFSVSASHGWC